jgi:diguanylate cyclase (GGDEF)-like protein
MNLPPGSPSILGLGTMTLLMGITFLMQAIAIYINSRAIKEYHGMQTGFFATLAMSIGYLLLVLHTRFGFVVGLTSNLAILTGNMLIHIAVSQFTERAPQRWVTHVLIPFGYLALALTIFLPIPIIIITDLANIPLSAASAWVLLRSDNRAFRSGARLAAFSLLAYALISLARILIVLISPGEILPGQSTTNSISILAIYILSYLWTAGFILMISQRLQNSLHDLAMNDMLTRVRNRRAMHELLNYELRRAERRIKDFSIILLDIDHFKRVNDLHGHDTGDEALKWMAANLQSSARHGDTVSRWGGEEFLILLPATELEEAIGVAERMRTYIESTEFKFKDISLQITFSAGVSCSKDHPNIDDLCKIADQALYIAKSTRNRVVSQHQITEEA